MKHTYYELFQEVFQITLIGYLLLLAVESFKTGAVSDFFNTNYLLVVVLGSGLGMAATQPKTHEQIAVHGKQKVWTEDNVFFMLFLSITGGSLVYVKTASMGMTSYIVSGFTCVLIFLLSVLVFSEDGNN